VDGSGGVRERGTGDPGSGGAGRSRDQVAAKRSERDAFVRLSGNKGSGGTISWGKGGGGQVYSWLLVLYGAFGSGGGGGEGGRCEAAGSQVMKRGKTVVVENTKVSRRSIGVSEAGCHGQEERHFTR